MLKCMSMVFTIIIFNQATIYVLYCKPLRGWSYISLISILLYSTNYSCLSRVPIIVFGMNEQMYTQGFTHAVKICFQSSLPLSKFVIFKNLIFLFALGKKMCLSSRYFVSNTMLSHYFLPYYLVLCTLQTIIWCY